MTDNIMIVLDKCLERIRRGETAEQCLADYPELRPELEPLLKAFQRVAVIRRVAPSAEFKQTAYTHLMSQIKADSRQNDRSLKKRFNFSSLRQSLAFKTLVPVTLVVVLALIVWVALPLFSPVRVAADEFTLSILAGRAEIKAAESSPWSSGKDGLHLKAGSRVRTPSDSFALLTFFDSSTIKLEPGTELLVSRSEYVDQRSANIQLDQRFGTTWSYVARSGEEKAHFTVHTPQGYAEAEGTAFSTEVDRAGKTRFTVAEGAIQVVEGDQKVRVEANKQIEVLDKIALAEPLPVPPSENELLISTTLPGIGSVRDPNGASTGHFPDGVAFNQITNSKSELSTAGQQILISEPVSGEYVMAVRNISGDDMPVSIQAKRNGKVVFQYSETLKGTTEKGWIIRIKLDTADRSAVSADVVSTEPLTGKAPENVIETDLAKKRATPITPTGPQDTILAAKPGATPSLEETSVPVSPVAPTSPAQTEITAGSAADNNHISNTPFITNPAIPTTAVPEVKPAPPGTTPVIPRDTTAPAVISTKPGRDATAVNVDEIVTVRFSENMNAASINETTFTLLHGSIPVSGLVSYDERARTAALVPDDNLEADTTYTATVTSKAADPAGNGLIESYTWSFTTGSDNKDRTPPSITSVSPESNAGDTAVNAVIEVTFDEDISLATLTDINNFRLTDGSTSVSCEAAYDSTTQTATFTPEESLYYATTYTATITTGITDLAGNHLASNYSWSFSTGVPSQEVLLTIKAPAAAVAGSTLDVNINVSEVTDLSAFEFTLSYDETVIQTSEEDSAVTPGIIGSSKLEYENLVWSFIPGNEGKLRILGVIKGSGVTGSGTIMQIHFKVVGEAGRSSTLTLSKTKEGRRTMDLLFDDQGETIATYVNGGSITVSP
jgi:hypothetical protein